MKRALFIILPLVLFLLYVVVPTKALAEQGTASAMQEKDSTVSSKMESEYTLPYPGVLPDNPLHFLKALRDRMVSFLISDVSKRAEFNLLTSDKRAFAAQMLASKNKDELAVSTFSKSNNYMHEVIIDIGKAKGMGKNVDMLLHNTERAIVKHEQVAEMVKGEIAKKYKGQMDTEIKRLQGFEKSANKLDTK